MGGLPRLLTLSGQFQHKPTLGKNTMRVLGVFAHNESKRIQRCLESIEAANCNRDLRCIVLANGCTDNTAELARNHAHSRKWIEVKEIAVGDKANAWNLFVHEIAANSEIYFFMDGDCIVQAGAFQELEQALAHAPLANAATGIPRRSLTSFGGFRRSLLKNPGLAGNLYALPLQFIKRIKLANVRLPVGLVGDDSIVSALACWDLDPSKKNWDFNRIAVVREAEFGYDSILSSTFGAPLFYPRKLRRFRGVALLQLRVGIWHTPLERSQTIRAR